MWRWVIGLFIISIISGGLIALQLLRAQEAKEKAEMELEEDSKSGELTIVSDTKQIDRIMKKLHSGSSAIHVRLGQGLRVQLPWKGITPFAREYVPLAEELVKYQPSRGAKAHWVSECDKLTTDARALLDACADQKHALAWEIWQKMNKGCTSCHDEHR
jgi:hypothetical protein